MYTVDVLWKEQIVLYFINKYSATGKDIYSKHSIISPTFNMAVPALVHVLHVMISLSTRQYQAIKYVELLTLVSNHYLKHQINVYKISNAIS